MASDVRITEEDLHGWRVHRLASGPITLGIAPDIGGRILSMTYQGIELLFTQPEHRGEVLDLGALRPTPLVPLCVHVVSARGGPVSGAEVSAGGATVRTDRRGRANVRAPGNDASVRVRHAAHATAL